MKKKLKSEIISKRELLPREELLRKSAEIKKKLFSLKEFINSQTIMFYTSIKSEVYTHDMITEALISKKVAIPVVDKVKDEISPSEIKDFSELSQGTFGILEPKKDFIRKILPEEIDLVIVPGIAFDIKGHRIGYGKGYYDRLLKKTKAVKIGFAFELQIIDEVPKEAHDVPMDKIITEKRIIDCI
jgi:5-formyltetrahydrofolate cyclo-ligase